MTECEALESEFKSLNITSSSPIPLHGEVVYSHVFIIYGGVFFIKRTSGYAFPAFIILVIIGIGGLFWVNFKTSSFNIGGGDFYSYWFGTRALLIEGVSPYDESVTRSIQTTLSTNKLNKYYEDSLISMPLYAVIITMPFAAVEDFELARAFWMTAQEIALGVLILIMLKVTNWKPRIHTYILLVSVVLITNFTMVILIAGNMIVWTSLFIILALGAIQAERDELAGGILSLTTFQPHVFIFSNVFILIWAILRKRRLLVIWYFGLFFIMTIIGVFLISDWPIQYLRIVLDTFENSNFVSLQDILVERWPGIGAQLSWILTTITTAILIVEWWLARFSSYRWFLWTFCLTLVLSRIIGAPVHLIHSLVLYIPVALVLSVIRERWQTAGSWINAVILIGLMIWVWFLILHNSDLKYELLIVMLMVVLPILILTGLYWVRWWAIRSQRLYIPESLSRG